MIHRNTILRRLIYFEHSNAFPGAFVCLSENVGNSEFLHSNENNERSMASIRRVQDRKVWFNNVNYLRLKCFSPLTNCSLHNNLFLRKWISIHSCWTETKATLRQKLYESWQTPFKIDSKYLISLENIPIFLLNRTWAASNDMNGQKSQKWKMIRLYHLLETSGSLCEMSKCGNNIVKNWHKKCLNVQVSTQFIRIKSSIFQSICSSTLNSRRNRCYWKTERNFG